MQANTKSAVQETGTLCTTKYNLGNRNANAYNFYVYPATNVMEQQIASKYSELS
jgi:hypothetical protein